MGTESDASESAKKQSIAGWEIGALLGKGPLGEAYAAHNPQTGAKAVYRGFDCPQGLKPSKWQRMTRHLSKLIAAQQSVQDHPGIQDIVEFGEEGNLFYVFTEFFEGKNLRQILKDSGTLRLDQTLDIFTQVAAAIDYAAQRGVTHTDLTHYNILVTNDSKTVRVINFALGKSRQRASSPYLAPEQLDGEEGDSRSDVFSLGVLIYHSLRGKRPFGGETREDLQRAIRSKQPSPLQNQPQYVNDVLAKMMHKQPAGRYLTCAEALNDLREGNSPVEVGLPAPTPRMAMNGLTRSLRNVPGISSLTGTFKRYRPEEEFKAYLERTADKEKREKRDQAYYRANARGIAIKVGIVAVILGLCVHAALLPNRYRYAQVIQVKGSPKIVLGKTIRSLSLGETIDGKDKGVLVTDANSSITLDFNGTRVKLAPNTALEIQRIGFSSGPVRQFSLKRGQVTAKVKPLRGGNAKFEIACNGVRAKVKGTEFTLLSAPNGVSIQTAEGAVSLDTGTDRDMVKKGEKLLALANQALKDPEKLTPEEIAKILDIDLEASKGLLASLDGFYTQIQEMTLVPLVNGALSLTPIQTEGTGKGLINDVKALATARITMEAISKSLMLGEEGIPKSLTLTTLEELPIKEEDRKMWLGFFEDNRLLSYKSTGDSYEIIARANDSNHTTIRAVNGKVTAGDEEGK